jgi:hypothetical protein
LLAKGKKALYYSFTAMAELLAETLLDSESLEEVRLEVEDKWLGPSELLRMVDILR